MIKQATTTARHVPITFGEAGALDNGVCVVKHVQPTTAGLHGHERNAVVALAGEMARQIRNHTLSLQSVVGESMMPAEAVNELDEARACLERLIHWKGGGQTEGGVSGEAMLAVQRVRAALDLLSHDIQVWQNKFADEDFPQTVLAAFEHELSRGPRLLQRARECGK
ncbi:MAG: hypothetical protein WA117_11680 [Verrucomicrobiia bacterium]